jgi:hypothetical protein
MTIFRQIMIGLLLSLSLLSTSVLASYFEWQVLETDHYKLYFHPSNKVKALEALNELNRSRPFVQDRIGNMPHKMPVVLEEVGQSTNGMVRLLPLRMYLFTEYPSGNPFRQSQYFLRLLTTHELVHAAHLTEVAGVPKSLVRWLGDLFYPNLYSPRWYLEGVAVNIESEISAFDGRLNDPYTEAYFAYHAKHKTLKSLGQVSFPMTTYLLGATPYLYGGRFLRFLETKYGNGTTQSFIQEYGKNPWAPASIVSPAFAFDEDMATVYKKTPNQLYKEWKATEETSYSNWNIEGDLITSSGWYKNGLIPYKDGVISYETQMKHPAPFVLNPIHKVVHYTASGDQSTILNSSRKLNAVPALNGDVLYVSREYIQGNYENVLFKGFGTASQITQVNLKSGRKKTRYVGPVTAFDVNDLDELFVAIRDPGSYRTQLLRVFDDERTVITELPFAISELRLFGDSVLMVAKEKIGHWNLYTLSLSTLELTQLFQSPWAVYGLNSTPTGATFTSNHNKTRHTYEWRSEPNTIVQRSHGNDASHGAINQDRLYFVSFSEKGEDIYVSHLADKAVDLHRVYSPLPPAKPVSASSTTSAVRESLSGLKEPSLKLFPFLYDEDDLGLVQYSTSYSTLSGVSIMAASHHIRPATFGVLHQYERTYGFIQTPLYRAATHRLLGLGAGVLSDFETTTQLQAVGRSESRFGQSELLWSKDLEENEALVQFSGSLYLGDSSLSVAYASSEGLPFYDAVRGYHYAVVSDGVEQNLRWDAKRKLLEINQGLWVPPVAAGSVFLGAFSDYSSYFDKHAAGAYVSFETQALIFPVPMVVTVGQSYSEGESRGFLALEIQAIF